MTQLEFGKVLKQLLRENKKLMRCTNLTFGRLGLQFCENVDLWAGPAISQPGLGTDKKFMSEEDWSLVSRRIRRREKLFWH